MMSEDLKELLRAFNDHGVKYIAYFQRRCFQSFKALRSNTGSCALACGSRDVGFNIPRVPSAAADFTLGYALVAPPALSIIVSRAIAETLNQ